ncbi:vacuolar membrane-associated protein iml1 [Pseudocyphellaria aurata]|nr:vacuolar membrane-associated protein iml1 [Pseudocyphellaria aurata]
MSNPKVPRPPPFRTSHLRKVSVGRSSTAAHQQTANSAIEATPITFPQLGVSSDPFVRRLCSLWVHDESYAAEDVVVNLSQFPVDNIRVGDLLQIIAIRDRDQDVEKNRSSMQNDGGDRIKKRDTSHDREASAPVSIASAAAIPGASHLDELHLDRSKRYEFVVKRTTPEQNAKQPGLQVSVSTHVATKIGFKNRSPVVISALDQRRASHVEITFRDEYLTRADMWGLVVATLANRTVYKNQRISFMGTIKALIKTIFVQGQKVQSAFFDSSTKPIFRSESARYVLFIQMSKEMWDFDADGTGEIMFSKVINGFLPELFKRWEQLGVKHLVSIVLFTRLEYERGLTAGFVHAEMDAGMFSMDNTSYRDFYRVVVSDVTSAKWANILRQLKAEFKVFLRDVSVRRPSTGQYLSLGTGLAAVSTDLPTRIIAGHPSAAIRGNILEAINLASSQFSSDHIDRDLVRTGISICVVTAGTGLFEVDYNLLRKTTEDLIENGVSIDLVCLSRMPLHSVPLFKYWQHEPPPREGGDSWNEDNEHTGDETSSRSYDSVIRRDSTSQVPTQGAGTSLSEARLKPSRPGFWKYGIPHWIDVSFWTSSSDEDRTQAAILGKPVNKISPANFHWKGFIPRVRMYELQMMGVMEEAMSEFSVPYLSRNTRASSTGQESSREPRKSGSGDILFRNQGVQHAGLGYGKDINHTFLGSTSTPSLNSRIHEHGLQNTQWMDEYDEFIFRHPRRRSSKETEKSDWKQRQRPRGHILRTRRRRDHSPPKFESSSSAHGSSVDGKFNLEGRAKLDPTINSKFSAQVSTQKRGSISSIISSSNASSKKPPKLSRQISFGPRGFSGTLKATPSTEISAEHANSASLLSRGSRPTSSGNAKKSISSATVSARSQKLNKRTSIDRSPDQEDNMEGSIVPVSISPRPIPIRRLTTIRVGKEDRPDIPEEKIAVFEALSASEKTGFQEKPTSSLRSSALVGAENFADNTSGSPMAPWLTILNPSNPHTVDPTSTSRLGRWQHVYPRPLRTSKIKWKSLCSPASVPLTTEDYPSADQLAEQYAESHYRVSPLEEVSLLESRRSQDWLLREMMAFRFSQGFQVVVGPRLSQTIGPSPFRTIDIFENSFSFEKGSTIFMSRGSIIHQLSIADDGDIDVRSLTRRTLFTWPSMSSNDSSATYIRTMFAGEYTSRKLEFFPDRKLVNWELHDLSIAGRDISQSDSLGLHYFRARFVLIPVDPPSNGRRPLHPINEDDNEEVRLEGIRRLTQIWQRFRHVPSAERRFQSTTPRRNDTNPLDIMYRTLNPSAIVAAELDSMGENDPTGRPIQLLSESDLYQRSNLNLGSLAQVIQSERGVRMMDRRWHWRLHYNCFIGFELTTWILQNFRDVETREEAVEVGDELLKRGLFQHVEQRHNFRDGNYFYQILGPYRAARPESGRNWFGSRKADKSVPSTPMSDGVNKDSPKLPRSRASSTGENYSETETSTPTENKPRLGVTLSKSLLYDVDHRKRSHRPEVVYLHYDRLHNPDNCYHIRLEWMNATAKLVEDAVVSWATAVDRFGLRLVEVPIGEASAITKMHPFRAPYLVKLALHPPRRQPLSYFDATSFAPLDKTEKHFYQKAIMKRFHFVLDFEAAKDFPPDVDVAYSWGKPDYRFPQYIHRSGNLLAQITDDGNFLLLANRLYNNRSASSQEPANTDDGDPQAGPLKSSAPRNSNHRGSPHSSPSFRAKQDVPPSSTGFRSSQAAAFVAPEQIIGDFEAFCQDAIGLDQFYSEVLSKSSSPGPNTPFLESSIPTLGLPPSLTLKEGSPTSSPGETKPSGPE